MRPTAYRHFGIGEFAAVALGAGEGWLAARFGDPRQPGGVEVWRWSGTDLSTAARAHRFELGAGTPAFPRIAWWNGEVWLFYSDGLRGLFYNLTTGESASLAVSGNSPGCFGAGFFAWQGPQAQAWPVSRLRLGTAEIVPEVRRGVGTGLSRVLADGTVVTIDEDRLALPGATQPAFADDLAVGEGPDGGTVWQLWRGGAAERGLIPWGETPQLAFTPRCAVDGERIAVCTAGGPGIRVFCGTRDELRAFSAAPGSGTGTEPGGGTDPGGGGTTPMATLNDDPYVKARATLEAERAKLGDTISAEQAGALLNRVAWAHRSDGWGQLRKDSGNRAPHPGGGFVSTDWLVNRQAHLGVDCLTDGPDFDPPRSAPARPSWGEGEAFDESRFVAPVEPAGSGTGGGTEPGGEEPGGDTSALAARVAALETKAKATDTALTSTNAAVNRLDTRVAALEARPSPGGETGGGASPDAIADAVLRKLLERLLGRVA